MTYDLILINGTIRSMDSNLAVYRWLAVSDGKIVALGVNDDYPKEGNIIDLKGKTVLPGLIDSHLHGSLTGLSLSSVDLRDASNINELLSMIDSKCKTTREGELVIGTNMSAEALQEKRLPDRKELDLVSSKHPILIHHVTMHGCVTNSMAFQISQLKTGMEGVELYEDGSANGIISDDSAYYLGVGHIMENMSEESIQNLIKKFTDSLPASGVTTVHTLDGQDLPMDEQIWHKMQGKHPVHVVNYLETLDVQKARAYGYPRVG